MKRQSRSILAALLALAAVFMTSGQVDAGEQARAIINALDPKSMNELVEVSRTQRDAALTNVIPTTGNRFRFLFVWPASNPVMTYERIGQSFAERFTKFAEAQAQLASGYCLLTRAMSFGTATYDTEVMNVAYRDIEVRYLAGPRNPCPGRYLEASDVEADKKPTPPRAGYGVLPPASPVRSPEDGLRPFLSPPQTTP